MPEWDDLVGPAVEQELRRQDGARHAYDTDADYRAGLAALAEHLAVVATVMEGQGFPRFSVEDTLRQVIAQVVGDGLAESREREQRMRAIHDMSARMILHETGT